MTVWIMQQGLSPEEETQILAAGYLLLPYEGITDLTHIHNAQEARHMLRLLNPADPPETITRQLDAFWPLHTTLQPEDIIAVPLPATQKVALARVGGPYEYRTSFEAGDTHLIPVEWLRDPVPMRAFGKHRELFTRPGLFEVTDVDARTAIRGQLPHSYNRFHKWKWLLAIFTGMGLLHLLANLTR